MPYKFYSISAEVDLTAKRIYKENGIDPFKNIPLFFESLNEFADIIPIGCQTSKGFIALFAYGENDSELYKLSNNIYGQFTINNQIPDDGVNISFGETDAQSFVNELSKTYMKLDKESRKKIREQILKINLEDASFDDCVYVKRLQFIAGHEPSGTYDKIDDYKKEVQLTIKNRQKSHLINKHKSLNISDVYNKLAGAEELKSYLEELEAMLPILKKWKAENQTISQHIMFSIDSGNGCTTMLKILHGYMAENGLFGGKSKGSGYGFKEIFFYFNESASANLESALDEVKKTIAMASPGLVGIHIEDWIKHLDHQIFVRLLKFCWESRENTVFVFIVPFVDENVLNRVYLRMCDVLNMRLIKFPPYTDEQLTSIAKNAIRDYGFKWDNSVDNCFVKALVRERSDQRFYGMRTVIKLSTEIALMKARNIALRRNNAPENVLVAEDFAGTIASENNLGEISGFEELDNLIGLENVKKRVREIVASIKVQKQLFDNGNTDSAPCYHMMFTGNPGTGKTMIARIIGKIFMENGLLPRGDLLEVSRWDMVGEYIGQTGPKTVALCNSSKGCVMFIDEAYLLCSSDGVSTRDFGREALGALIAEMENKRTQFVVIMAGYEKEMENLLNLNAGLRDRMPHKLHFESYTREQLFEIFKYQLIKGYSWDKSFMEKAEMFFKSLPLNAIESEQFGNGRFVRNIVERTRTKAMMRMFGKEYAQNNKIHLLKTDLESALADTDISGLNQKNKAARVGFMLQ